MPIKVYLSTAGRPLDPAEASISVFDRGFLYGDSVYETLRTAGGRFVDMRRHLVRLRASAAGIGLDVPHSDEAIRRVVRETCDAAGNPDSYIRIILTRGTGPLMLDPRVSGAPLLVVIVKALQPLPPELYERGISAAIVDVLKPGRLQLDPSLKTGNYLNSILALRQAIDGDAEDAILCNAAGAVAEGATSNVFMVAGGRVLTPSFETGLLKGITRTVVVELAAAQGLQVEEVTIMPAELRAADEVFLTSSVRGVMPVTRLDGVAVHGGQVGPVTRRMIAAYRGYIDAIARGASSE
ncbi:MAG: aminotransferase class IV [Myxococcales bacterium]|nr:aminotransferase class IV [Myxococcales bacterium]MCB9752607.1 aminotransferase class IV [Myxococcales bacterium]